MVFCNQDMSSREGIDEMKSKRRVVSSQFNFRQLRLITIVSFTVLVMVISIQIYTIAMNSENSKWPRRVVVYNDFSNFAAYISLEYIGGDSPHIIQKISRIEYFDNPYPLDTCIDSISIPNKRWLRTFQSSTTERNGLQLKSHECTPGTNPKLLSEDVKSITTITNMDDSHVYITDDEITSASTIALTDAIPLSIQTYTYPYESVILDLNMNFFGYNATNSKYEQQKIPAEIFWKLNFPGWEIANIDTKELSQLSDTTNRVFSITLIRLSVYRLLTPFIIGLLLIFILIIPFIPDAGTLAQVALGMIFGIWTTKQALLPTGPYPITMLDVIFLGLYSLLALMTLIWLLRFLYIKNNDKYTLTDEQLLWLLLDRDI